MIMCKCGGEIKVIHSSNGTYGKCKKCNYIELNEFLLKTKGQ